MRTAHKFRIYPNKQQSATLDLTLETCRRLWNIALEDRKVNWELNGIFRSYEDQAAILTSEKKIYPELCSVYSQVLQDVLKRLKKAFDNFFRRVKAHEKENVYKPIIMQFKGFFGKDFFGVDADNARAEIYYAPVRSRSEHKEAQIGEVIGRLNELDLLLKEPQIRHDLAEIDFQLSLLPSMMGSCF